MDISTTLQGDKHAIAASSQNIRAMLKECLSKQVFSVLQEAGELADRLGVSAYVVGGFVRDLLHGVPNLDVDVVIVGDGIAFARCLARKTHATVTTYERFGTARVRFQNGDKLDITTARTEYYESPAALPRVRRSSIERDLFRRDFTINTLAVCLNHRQFGNLIDLYGGRRDLKEKRIRVLHGLSFVDDPTRVFRALRLECRFGFHLSEEIRVLITEAVNSNVFRGLSGHRLLEELIHLLSEQEVPHVVARLAELNLLQVIHPKLRWSPRLKARLKAAQAGVVWYRGLHLDIKIDSWLVYFMILMEVLSDKAVGEALARLRMPTRYAGKIRDRSRMPNLVKQLGGRNVTSSRIYHLLQGLSPEGLLALRATPGSSSLKKHVSAYITIYQHVKPALTGTDLKAMGLSPGPVFTKILDRVRAARLNNQVNTAAQERALARRIAKSSA
jgi:tRNA nucleotidyltransferase (CCA-adding enzyme)